MEEIYETYAYFYVSGFEFDYLEITKKLEINPTKAWNKGEEWLPTKERKFSSWEIHSSLSRSEIFLNTHIESVLDIIEPKVLEILELKNQGCDLGINCVGYYRNAHPGFNLSAKIISRPALFSIDIDFDLYCLCDANE